MNDLIRRHFDALAERWDSIVVHPHSRVERVLSVAGDLEGKIVIDVGSGTGILLPYLLSAVGERGRVIALDVSSKMLAVSRGKHSAPNLAFAAADFIAWDSHLKADLVIAYSCYPHFTEPAAFWRSATSALHTGGLVLVAHIEGRESINGLHAESAATISVPLGPVGETADLAANWGFTAEFAEDTEQYYIFLARLAI